MSVINKLLFIEIANFQNKLENQFLTINKNKYKINRLIIIKVSTK